MTQEIRFKIDGKEVVAKPGETVIQVAHRYGIPIPHYCYHPGLPVDGNCRMCLAKFAAPRGDKIVPFPKPMTTCTTYPTEGMEVDTRSEEVQKMREQVMEFLLINHPLDCPICDQAGECSLQDYAYQFGRPKGRFKEEKVHKHKKVLGKYVILWGERCILCRRCIRFLDHISGTSELCVVERGDRAVIDVFDENHPLDNPLSLNVVDICPVGALLSRDFLFKQRVWYMKSKYSVCAGCAKGCNIIVDYDIEQIRRIRAKPNPDVNDYWLCDYGRMFFKHTHSEKRLRYWKWEGKVTPREEVLQKTAERFKKASSVAVLGSLFLTCEAMYVLKKLANLVQAKWIGALERPVEEDQVFPGFRIPGDKNPNRRGFEAIFGKDILEKGFLEVVEALEREEVEALLVASSIPEFEPSERLLKAVEKAKFFALLDILENPLTEKADALMAGSTYTEENGIFVHEKGKWQKLSVVMLPPEQAKQNYWVLEALRRSIAEEPLDIPSQKEVREEMFKKEKAFENIPKENFYPELHNLPVGSWINEHNFSPTIGKRM